MIYRCLALTALAAFMAAAPNPPQPVRLPLVRVRSGRPAAILLDVRLPKGWSLDPAAALRWRFTETWAGFTFAKRKDALQAPKLPLRIAFQAATGATGARLAVDFRYCRKSEPNACRDGFADYIVVLQGDEKESNIKVPVTIQDDKD